MSKFLGAMNYMGAGLVVGRLFYDDSISQGYIVFGIVLLMTTLMVGTYLLTSTD